MDVDALPLSSTVRDHLRERGVDELYPPQAAAVEAGALDGGNLVVAVPTASGKTLIAQLAMLSADGPALYVVPLRALAAEKYETFAALPDVDVGMATGGLDRPEAELAGHDVVVATSEKVDAALRTGAAWVEAAACVVVDEIHLLDAEGRGPTLEMTLAKLRRRADPPQIVGLSATVDNAGAVADWLDADLVESDWRPVELRRGIYDDGSVAFEGDGEGSSGSLSVDADDRDPAVALARDAVEDGGQCLVFVRSRRRAQELAGEIAEAGLAFPDEVTEEIRTTATTATGTELARRVARGVAFHHAGLRDDHRAAVEAAFRDGDVQAICATPTLAAGVNTPARRVVVRDHRRYGDDGFEPLSTLEVHQMFGRAGRPGMDPYGEAILVAGRDDPDELRERYLQGDPEPVASQLDDERALRTHVLAAVAGGAAPDRSVLGDLFGATFHAHQHGAAALSDAVDAAIASLAAEDLLSVGDDGGATPARSAGVGDDAALSATDLGTLIARVYVDPTTGTDVVAAIERAAALEAVTPLTVLEFVCATPEVRNRRVRDDEAGRISEAAIERADELARSVEDFEGDFRSWLGAFKTAALLADLAAGEDLGRVAERYGVAPGDVRRTVERAEWLLGATASLADHVEADGADRVRRTIRETRRALADRAT